MLTYLTQHYDRMLTLTYEHILLTVVTLVIALLFALPIGLLLYRVHKLSVPVVTLLSLLYVIPSMAMFAILIPFVGLGLNSAIIALVAYCQLILVRNILAAFQSIDPSIIEAAKGMGLSSIQRFWKIELPLALPIILGGIRIAATSTIGIATIASWINAGGLGTLLFEGLYQNNSSKIIWGTILVSALAIATNQLLFRVEKRASIKAKGQQIAAK
jgi:osmoprotectant transport system permease protein